MRWPRGCPPALYVAVCQDTGEYQAFHRKNDMLEFVKTTSPTRDYHPDEGWVKMKYVQEESK